MSIKKSVIALTLSAFIVPAAFADNGWSWVDDQIGWTPHATPSSKSRAEVNQELEEFRNNPVDSAGWSYAGNELGYVPPQHSYGFEKGKVVHTDEFDHGTPHPVTAMTDEERLQYEALYTNG
ncbi:DUF4148 domain-containing protein [Sedimenticola hydrogenitrophicus]|uniref:DUF4148 domain-containing protein n=1 Tax=Sedimenticola hydrogenitrophicus TaxID=2967975 RepID=UPI0021A3CD0D|nr:DUF4148 domain-containing protein [Sedimenticola hydrogenitrophicus]